MSQSPQLFKKILLMILRNKRKMVQRREKPEKGRDLETFGEKKSRLKQTSGMPEKTDAKTLVERGIHPMMMEIGEERDMVATKKMMIMYLYLQNLTGIHMDPLIPCMAKAKLASEAPFQGDVQNGHTHAHLLYLHSSRNKICLQEVIILLSSAVIQTCPTAQLLVTEKRILQKMQAQ